MAAILCPYCFEPVVPHLQVFRCVNPDPTRCPPEADVPLDGYQNGSSVPQVSKTIEVRNVFWRPRSKLALCSCGTTTTRRICAQCHNDLPSHFGARPARSIALIGPKE